MAEILSMPQGANNNAFLAKDLNELPALLNKEPDQQTEYLGKLIRLALEKGKSEWQQSNHNNEELIPSQAGKTPPPEKKQVAISQLKGVNATPLKFSENINKPDLDVIIYIENSPGQAISRGYMLRCLKFLKNCLTLTAPNSQIMLEQDRDIIKRKVIIATETPKGYSIMTIPLNESGNEQDAKVLDKYIESAHEPSLPQGLVNDLWIDREKYLMSLGKEVQEIKERHEIPLVLIGGPFEMEDGGFKPVLNNIPIPVINRRLYYYERELQNPQLIAPRNK